ncbi:MAG: hypothetical protein AB9897_05675 [Anaerolineaceae bacterium]
MNKWIVSIVVVVAVVAIALGSTSSVFAQSSAPYQGAGYGNGMGGRGTNGGMMGTGVTGTSDGVLHDNLVAFYAAKLGISVEDLNSRLANGETLSSIALSTGMTIEQFTSLRVDARNQAIDQAVKDGTLTQTQADWMKTRGFGTANGTGVRGTGQGQFANLDCPYYQTNQ